MTAAGPELLTGAGERPVRPAARLAWLDALRGVAVLAVVVQHGGEIASRGFARVTHRDAQLGQGGVLLFFLVSGFVIPLTLDRGPSLRRFATARLLRLYPAYWVSIAAVALLWRAGAVGVAPAFRHGAGPWLANATMLQTLLGRPQLQGQYWSLVFELIFYALSALLLALGLHRRSVALAVGALAVALGLHLLARATGHTVPLGLGNIATMFVGSVLYRVVSGAVAPRTGWRLYAAAALAVQLVLVLRLAGRTDGTTGVPLTLASMSVAWAGAYAVFGAAVALRDRLPPLRPLVVVGEVSYSVYLLHALVIDGLGTVPAGAATAPVSVVVWGVLGVAAGWVSWRLVERPAGALGRRLGGRRDAVRDSR